MTITSTSIRNTYNGPGAGPFDFNFRIFAGSDLEATLYQAATGLTIDLFWLTDFTINPTGINNRSGGTMTPNVALAAGDILALRRNPATLQLRDVRNQGAQYPATLEDGFDYAMMIAQRQDDDAERSLKLSKLIDPATVDMTLPPPLAGAALIWNVAGTGLDNGILPPSFLTPWQAANQMFNDTYTSAHGDFTPGVSTTLVLSQTSPGSANNLLVSMRVSGTVRLFESDEFSLAGHTVTFASAIPAGATRVEIKYLYTYQINTADSSNVTYLRPAATGAVSRSVQSKLSDMVFAADFGVVGDGITDDTVKMQDALTYAQNNAKVLYCGAMAIKITGPLTTSGPGIIFDRAGYGNASDPGIYATGVGYVALTASGSIHQWTVSVYGTGNALTAAIVFANPQASVIMDTRVYNFACPGVVINECFDCLFGTISVELCGTAAALGHAFQINDGGGTSNMTHILRLQVEQANTQAIFVSGNSLCIIIDSIHSERLLNPDLTKNAWSFDGAACSFNGGRFESSGTSANAVLLMQGEDCNYIAFRAEGNIVVKLAGSSSTGITVITPNFSGTAMEVPTQSGAIVILGGIINAWSGTFANRYWLHLTNMILKDRTTNALDGDLKFDVVDTGIFIKQGANHGTCGRAQLVAGSVTVTVPVLGVNTHEIFLSYAAVSNVAHVGTLYPIPPGTPGSFMIKSTNAADDSQVSWFLVGRA